MRSRSLLLAVAALASLSRTPLFAQDVIRTCACDGAAPQTLTRRECSLSNEAEKQPAGISHFFLKDINPRKPNRTLALPRQHGPGRYSLDQLTKEERTALWTAAITKARELWGSDWAVAYNGDKVRTQCHIHIHIGRLNAAARLERFLAIKRPEQIPAPKGNGIWIYQSEGTLRVHMGEQITETALVR
jgi:diadenosine tetraphosphate (Ap4A) HIT family hydrolase